MKHRSSNGWTEPALIEVLMEGSQTKGGVSTDFQRKRESTLCGRPVHVYVLNGALELSSFELVHLLLAL